MLGTANYSSEPRAEKLRSALTALARFHRAVEAFEPVSPLAVFRSPQCGPSPGIAERLRLTERLLAGHLDELDRAIIAPRVAGPWLVDQATILLATVRPRLPSLKRDLESVRGIGVHLQPCLRDIWHDHVLFTGDEVTGIVDLGSMRVESVAADVARLLGSLCGNDSAGWRVGLAAYEQVRPLSAAECALLEAFDRSQLLLAGINWVEWVFAGGRTFPDPEALVKRMEHILARLAPPVDPANHRF
jgi:homoserine kinase type II